MKRTLNRKTPLRRKRRMSRQSRTRRLQDDIYREKRRAFLARRPRCEFRRWSDGTPAPKDPDMKTVTTHTLDSVQCDPMRAQEIHQEYARQCRRRSTQVHHIRPNGCHGGKYYLAEEWWFPSCNCDHRWINDNGREAMRLGYVERVYEKH